MSIHHTSENEQENKLQTASLLTEQGKTLPPQRPSPPSSSQPPNRRWFTVTMMTIAILLLIAASAGIVALVRYRPQQVTPGTPIPAPTATGAATATSIPTTTPQPTATLQPTATAASLPAGRWMPSLVDYRVTEISAAPSQPNVLYSCAIAPGVPVVYQSVQTVLRSVDFGTTWQNMSSRAQMSRDCEFTINPTDSYEIYVATSSNPPADLSVPSYVLKHTKNGGDSWETIHPTVYLAGQNAPLPWQGTQLRFVGNRLYSVQALPLAATTTSQGWHPSTLARLLTSTDGGHTWHTMDTQLATSGLWAEAYAVNLAHPALFYELAYTPTEPGTAFPSLELYRSVDSGKTWQTILQHLPWMAPLSPATILLGSANPEVIYLTNTRSSAVQMYRADKKAAFLPLAGGGYSMCMSKDGGKNWRTLVPPNQMTFTMSRGAVDQQGRLYTQATTSETVEIWLYNPAADTWGKIAQAPLVGLFLATTQVGANGPAVLWFMSTNGRATLYRYITRVGEQPQRK